MPQAVTDRFSRYLQLNRELKDLRAERVFGYTEDKNGDIKDVLYIKGYGLFKLDYQAYKKRKK